MSFRDHPAEYYAWLQMVMSMPELAEYYARPKEVARIPDPHGDIPSNQKTKGPV